MIIFVPDYVRPICLPFPGSHLAKVGNQLVGTGWNSDTEESVNVKKRLRSTLISHEECASNKTEVTEEQFCTNEGDSKERACLNDVGGPITSSYKAQWTLEGIISDGGCEPDSISVHTNVTKHLDWIVERVRA